MKKNTRKGYGLFGTEQKGQRTMDIKNTAANPGPITYLVAFWVIAFVIELVALGNLWAINEIAGYFN